MAALLYLPLFLVAVYLLLGVIGEISYAVEHDGEGADSVFGVLFVIILIVVFLAVIS